MSLPLPQTSTPYPHCSKCPALTAIQCQAVATFAVPWSMTQSIVPSVAQPLEIGLTAGSKYPRSPNISGQPGMNCLLNLAFSSRGHGSAFPQNYSTVPLSDLHGIHHGIDRMQAHVREVVYWPGIDANIVDHVCWCTICTKHKASPMYSLCYLEISPMAHGRRSLPTASPTRVKSTYWYAICLASTPFYIKYPPSPPSHCPMHLQELISQ